MPPLYIYVHISKYKVVIYFLYAHFLCRKIIILKYLIFKKIEYLCVAK